MVLLDVRGLTKKFKNKTAINQVSFHIREGHCVSLLGPNGAGKTTTLKILSGLLKPTEGSIDFKGLNPKDDIRKHIGFLPQHPAFYSWMTGKEFLIYIGQLAFLSKSEAEKRAIELLERMGLASAITQRIGTYSGGMKQRLGLAQAMIHRPKLLILDEPVSALDPVGRREVLEMISELKEHTTVLFSTHVLHDAEEISDDVMIIRDGNMIIAGEWREIQKQYQQPVIWVEAEEESELKQWLAAMHEHEMITEIIQMQNTAKLAVKDLQTAKSAILHDIVAKRLPILKFEVAETTLEDIFIKAVNE